MRLERKGGAYAILVASVAAVVACAGALPKSSEQERADAFTAERVQAALEANPIYYFRDVEARAPGQSRRR